MHDDAGLLRTQIRVLGIAEGFFQSSVLFALLELDVFRLLGAEGKTVDQLAEDLDARPGTLRRLLNAGVVFRLLHSDDGVTYRVAPDVAAVLLPNAGEHYLGNWIGNLRYFGEALDGLGRAVLTSSPSVEPSGHLGADREQTREFILAMHDYAALRGKELARFLDTSGWSSLLDLGCGPGTYAFHLGARNPQLRLHLLDLPDVLEVAREVEAGFELRNEVAYLPLDALKDEIPGSYDAILVSNTLHMLGEEASRQLIQRLYRSVDDGGSLIIQAQFLSDDGMGGRWPVVLDLLQLCMTEHGRNHSVAETTAWLEEAGFSDVEYCPMTLLNTNGFLRARKGGSAPAGA